jgi:hypothetical protein
VAEFLSGERSYLMGWYSPIQDALAGSSDDARFVGREEA